jgi:hypothetical protein
MMIARAEYENHAVASPKTFPPRTVAHPFHRAPTRRDSPRYPCTDPQFFRAVILHILLEWTDYHE